MANPDYERHSSWDVFYPIALITLVNIVCFIDRSAFSVLVPSIKAELLLSDGQMGALVGLATSASYAIFALPFAYWADRGNRRNVLALALALWSVMTALAGLTQTFLQMLAARIGAGAADGGGTPASQALIADYVKPENRPGAYAVFGFGAAIGTGLGSLIAGILVDTLGWRWALVSLGLPGVLLALVVRLTLQEPERGRLDSRPAAPHSSPAISSIAGALIGNKTYKWLLSYITISALIGNAFAQWWPTFFFRAYGLDFTNIGFYLGVIGMIGMGTGVLLGGIISNFLARRNLSYPLYFSSAAAILNPVFLLLALLSIDPLFTAIYISFGLLVSGISLGPVNASINSVVAPSFRAIAIAIAVFCSSFFGLAVGPSIIGLGSDFIFSSGLSAQSESLRSSMLYMLLIAPVPAVILFFAARSLNSSASSEQARPIDD